MVPILCNRQGVQVRGKAMAAMTCSLWLSDHRSCEFATMCSQHARHLCCCISCSGYQQPHMEQCRHTSPALTVAVIFKQTRLLLWTQCTQMTQTCLCALTLLHMVIISGTVIMLVRHSQRSDILFSVTL